MYVARSSHCHSVAISCLSASCPRQSSLRLKLFCCIAVLATWMSQLTPFEIGQIKAHAYHGLGASAIVPLVSKPDGSALSLQGVVQS